MLHHVPERFFPFAERDQFVIDVWLPEGWKVEATDAAVRRIEDVLRHEKEVVNFTSFIGSSAPRFYYNVNPQLPDKNYAQLLVSTAVGGSDAEAGPGAAPAARAGGAGSPRLPERVAARSGPGGGHRSPAYRRRRARSAAIGAIRYSQLLQHTPGSLDVHSDWREDAYRMKVNLRRGGGQPSGIHQRHDRAESLRAASKATRSQPIGKAIAISRSRCGWSRRARQSFNDVANTYVISPVTGARVPLDSIATVSPVWDPGRIVRRNGVRTLTIRSWAQGGVLPSQVLEQRPAGNR